MKLFSIYDSKASVYLRPFMSRTTPEALRSLQAVVDDVNHEFCKYAEDYTLFELGSWDELTCKYSLFDAKRSIVTLNELKKQPLPVQAVQALPNS